MKTNWEQKFPLKIFSGKFNWKSYEARLVYENLCKQKQSKLHECKDRSRFNALSAL